MKFSKLFSQSMFLAIMILLHIVPANADYIVDTGPGLNERGGSALYNTTPVNGDFQFLAVEFFLDRTYTLTDLEGWIYHEDPQNQSSHINFIIYGDGGNIPDVNNELYNQIVTVSSYFAPQWHGLTGLNWTLSSGEYWLAFEVRQPELLGNAMPPGAPNPQPNSAYYNGGNLDVGYLPESLGYGVRIQGTVVSEQVSIDIKPGSFPNSINLKSKGNVPVAILSSPTFDASTVDWGTVEFAGAPALSIGGSPEDVNSDGLLDLVLHFSTQSLNLTSGDTEACLTGKTLSGQEFKGCDSVNIVK
ncbi:MAG: hypothetical protein NT096_05300 [Proteobacteria bacterium]|nr:hypothetical protein [Pseudomonadota bacterium]